MPESKWIVPIRDYIERDLARAIEEREAQLVGAVVTLLQVNGFGAEAFHLSLVQRAVEKHAEELLRCTDRYHMRPEWGDD